MASPPTQLLRLLESLALHDTSGKNGTGSVLNCERNEVALLEFVYKRFERQREFTSTVHGGYFTKLLSQVQEHRFSSEWMSGAEKQHVLGVLRCLKMLLRDDTLLRSFTESTGSVVVLAQEFQHVSSLYMNNLCGEEAETVQEVLVELANIMHKCSSLTATHSVLIDNNSHELAAELIVCHDQPLVHYALSTLINLSKSESLSVICDLDLCEPLITIMLQSDSTSQQLASDLFLLLCQQPVTTHQLKESDLLASLLTLFKGNDAHLQQRTVAALERLLSDAELLEDFRQTGGIPLVLSLLEAEKAGRSKPKKEENKKFPLLYACFSLLTRVSISDMCAVEIVKANGIHLLASLAIPQVEQERSDAKLLSLYQQALRALRFLFSLERNRQIFKQLFPALVLEKFIDIGHYKYDLSHYLDLASMLCRLPDQELSNIHKKVSALNQHDQHICTIGGYRVLELLGSGAYGSVFKVRKGVSGSLFAMKEISTTNALFGKTLDMRRESIGNIMSEVAMIKQHLVHPNIVCYQKCFQEAQHLYIVMELLEGAPLNEHITSLKEKSLKFSEDRIWHIFSQIIRALNYLHKQKQIVHRDLKPANLMVGDDDKLTITDFGLAKQKKEFSVMNSTVGTMLYWCPELVQNEEYNEKADIWAAGCILYEMAALKAPFHSSNNILALATKIAEVDYERLPADEYSPLVGQVVERCLTYDKSDRPDSVQIGSMIAEKLMKQMDEIIQQRDGLHRKLNKERERRIRHLHNAVSSEQKYQQLLTHSRAVASGSARKRLSFSETETSSVSTSSLSTHFSPAHAPEIVIPTATPAVVHPELLSSPASDGAFEEEMTQLHYRKASSAGVIQKTPPHYQIHSRGSVGSAGPSLRHWARSYGDESGRSRSNSLSPMTGVKRQFGVLNISSKHVREVADPVSELLSLLHMIVYLSKVPLRRVSSSPGLNIVRQYERALFSKESRAISLKLEMRKLSTNSTENVTILPHCPNLLSRALKETATVTGGTMLPGAESDHINYEQLHGIIENLFRKHSNNTL